MTADQQDDTHFSPVVWFFVLEDAREHGDFAKAAEAQRVLRRLGIDVRYRPQREVCHAE